MYSCWFFFFFKQKTAYEMRISDWSSDVCSSDLLGGPGGRGDVAAEIGCAPVADAQHLARTRERHARERFGHWFGKTCSDAGLGRSEEHTSELQSLMRISYAVFCLKTNNSSLSHSPHYTPHQPKPSYNLRPL